MSPPLGLLKAVVIQKGYGKNKRKYNKEKLKNDMVTHHIIRDRSGRVRVFSKTNQSHGLGDDQVPGNSNSTLIVNRSLFLTTQNKGSCLQNGVR